MTDRPLQAGDTVDAYCGKCKLERLHHVIALVEGRVAKVLCDTCGAQHRYRSGDGTSSGRDSAGSGGKGSKEKKPRASGGGRSRSPARRWEEALAGKDRAAARPYAMQERYQEGDLIEHKRFGCGVVTRVGEDGRMQVLFEEEEKLLVCARAP